jgi:hypothetical protein
MARIEPIGEQVIPSSLAADTPLRGAWAKVKLVVSRAIFWSYERGSWQYDIICGVILAFIVLTPRSWFHDRPTLELSDLRHRQGVIEIGRTRAGSEYLVDSRLVESYAPLAPEEAVRVILNGRLNRPVTVKSLDPVLDKNNVMLGYTVVVSP